MKNIIITLLIITSGTCFASSIKKLECTNLPESYFPNIRALEVTDNYETRYRIHSVIYNDGSVKIHGSSYMREKSSLYENINLENRPARHDTYDFKINGRTLKLRADGMEHHEWFIDPLLDYDVDVVEMDCN